MLPGKRVESDIWRSTPGCRCFETGAPAASILSISAVLRVELKSEAEQDDMLQQLFQEPILAETLGQNSEARVAVVCQVFSRAACEERVFDEHGPSLELPESRGMLGCCDEVDVSERGLCGD